MQVIPVIDLMDGQVVRAIAGRRSEYQPVESQLVADAEPSSVARAFVERFGFETAYVADLDAIRGGPANVAAWQAIHDAGLQLVLDAGTGTPATYREVSKQLAARGVAATMVIALERLDDPWDLRWRGDDACLQRSAIFSLDLLAGVPMHHVGAWRGWTSEQIAREVYRLGYRNLVVLDLADVGVGGGTRTLALCKQLKTDLPDVKLIAGGGVRGIGDLAELAAAGCSGALVASALHDGRLTPKDIRSDLQHHLSAVKP